MWGLSHLLLHSCSMQIVLIIMVSNKFLGSLIVIKRSIKIYVIALGLLLASLYLESLDEEMSVEGFILVAVALVVWAAYSSIIKAPHDRGWPHTSLAFVCSILSVTSFFLPVVGWGLAQGWSSSWITPLKILVMWLFVIGGLISLYTGWIARSEWSEYHDRIEEESRPKDHGLTIS